ncbi:MAG TPA: hypothetical protein VMT52_08220 [Planctomycetota bacterium]|nr:hypothetical protein [Planctomycetota bacterium]
MLRKFGPFDSFGADRNAGENDVGDGDSDAEPPLEGSAGPRGLAERLPAFYRENPGLLAPALAAAEALLESLRQSVSGEEERWAQTAILDSSIGLARPGDGSRGQRAAGVAGGTHEDVERWLARRHRAAPVVWSGLEAVPHASGGIEMRKSLTRSAVIAWGEDEPPELEGSGGVVDLPRDLLPVGVRVHAVILSHLPEGRPRPGARHAGRIVALRGIAP